MSPVRVVYKRLTRAVQVTQLENSVENPHMVIQMKIPGLHLLNQSLKAALLESPGNSYEC